MSNPESELPGSASPEPNTESTAAGVPAKETSECKKASNRANASHSTGPRSEEGKRQSSQNARRPPISTRLLGFVEARTMNHEPAAALRLYHDLISPYPKAPPLLQRQFEDLARLYLELEAWERIRDAQIEDRWQQADIESRRSYLEMERDLPGTAAKIFAGGISKLPDSPAKFKELLDRLEQLKDQIVRRGPHIEFMLQTLYGVEIDPNSSRARDICMYCERLFRRHSNPELEPLRESQIEDLMSLLEAEMRDLRDAYTILLDEKTVTRSARMARLAPTGEDRWMEHQGDCLRRAVDRKLKFILTLLLTLGFEQRPGVRGRGTGAGVQGPGAGGQGPGDRGQGPGAGGQGPGDRGQGPRSDEEPLATDQTPEPSPPASAVIPQQTGTSPPSAVIPAQAGIHENVNAPSRRPGNDRTQTAPAPQVWRRHSGTPCPRRGPRAAAFPPGVAQKNFKNEAKKFLVINPRRSKWDKTKPPGFISFQLSAAGALSCL